MADVDMMQCVSNVTCECLQIPKGFEPDGESKFRSRFCEQDVKGRASNSIVITRCGLTPWQLTFELQKLD